MRVLICHASAGKGHQKAAEALYRYCLAHRPDLEAKIVDILDHSSAFFRFMYSWGYPFMVTRAIPVWKLSFLFTQAPSMRWLTRPIVRGCNALLNRPFIRYLIRENPDIILSTHFVTSEIAVGLKKRGRITSKVVTVVTDYGVHPFWLNRGTDEYIAASEYTKRILLKEGVPEERVTVRGIPIDEKFSAEFDREALTRKLGLEQGVFTVLLSTGSFGIGPFMEIIERLKDTVQCIAVCANNKALYETLSQKGYPRVKVVGFAENMDELMAVSDIMVAKPGGLTISESLAMGVYPVFVTAIPGQETENMAVLSAQGIGIFAPEIEKIIRVVEEARTNPGLLSSFRSKSSAIARPRAAQEIIDGIR